MSATWNQRCLLYSLQRGLCHWCGEQMILLKPDGKEKKFPPRMCTIDHLDSRLSSKRGLSRGERRRVAACLECNGRHNFYEMLSLPPEDLRARCGHYRREEVGA